MCTITRWSRRAALGVLPVLWIGGVCGGLYGLWRYSAQPGRAGDALSQWPGGSEIIRANDRPTLVMFAHPKCPCTRASIAELARVMTRCRGAVAAHVIFLRPANATMGWEQTDLWRSAAEIPGVAVQADRDGQEAARFAAYTSGQVLLYDAAGKLLFRGGITGARGHEGDNAGSDSVVALIRGDAVEGQSTDVFGCSLRGQQSYERD